MQREGRSEAVCLCHWISQMNISDQWLRLHCYGYKACALHIPPLEAGTRSWNHMILLGLPGWCTVPPFTKAHHMVAPCPWLPFHLRHKIWGEQTLCSPSSPSCAQSAKWAMVSFICHNYFTDVFHLSFTGMIFLHFLIKRMFAPRLGLVWWVQGECYLQTPGASSGILGNIAANPLTFSEIA